MCAVVFVASWQRAHARLTDDWAQIERGGITTRVISPGPGDLGNLLTKAGKISGKD